MSLLTRQNCNMKVTKKGLKKKLLYIILENTVNCIFVPNLDSAWMMPAKLNIILWILPLTSPTHDTIIIIYITKYSKSKEKSNYEIMITGNRDKEIKRLNWEMETCVLHIHL